MAFHSLAFLLFLAGVFALHWCRHSKSWQNRVLLAASYFFYGWWDWRFCILMLWTSVVDFTVGRALGRTSHPAHRRLLLALSLLSNLGVLGFFKYFGFFADSLAIAAATLGLDLGTVTLHIVLPVGISFYTLQSLTYTLDVYHRRLPPQPSVEEYLAFVAFFPQLVAGPIERARDLLPQFASPRTFVLPDAVRGCRLILWGLAKKMLLADNLGVIADATFENPATQTPAALALGILAFTFQIYGDFSGYSDIAAGTGRLFGISLSRNFAYPYFARNLSDFWRRWHRTLSAWYRDYVFIPLGGSRGSLPRTLRNILLTLLLSGLWHGAAWHFVAWGAWHALGLGIQHAWHSRRLHPVPIPAKLPATIFSTVLSTLATGIFVSLGWVWFRAADLPQAVQILSRLTLGWLDPVAWQSLPGTLIPHLGWMAAIVVFCFIEILGRDRWDPIPWERMTSRGIRWLAYTGIVWALLLWGTRRPTEFIYFQF